MAATSTERGVALGQTLRLPREQWLPCKQRPAGVTTGGTFTWKRDAAACSDAAQTLTDKRGPQQEGPPSQGHWPAQESRGHTPEGQQDSGRALLRRCARRQATNGSHNHLQCGAVSCPEELPTTCHLQFKIAQGPVVIVPTLEHLKKKFH